MYQKLFILEDLKKKLDFAPKKDRRRNDFGDQKFE